MNRKFIKAVLKSRFFLLLFALPLLFSCSPKKEYDWTILVYMAADNSLYQNALSDINEMEKAQFSDNIKVIVRVDLLELSEHLKQDGNTYDISHDENENLISSHIVKKSGEIDSGDYHSLINFANWGFDNYPSRKRALFIWSHGNAWYNRYNKFCVDQKTLDFIDIPKGDLESAFNQMNNKIDILGLDACNMQSIEVNDNLTKNVDYIIASEDVIKPDGFPYDDILNEWENYESAQNITQMINDVFYESYMPGGSQNEYSNIFPFGISTILTNKYKTLYDDIAAFLEMDLSQIRGEIVSARDNCYNNFDSDYSSQIDINEFFSHLNEELAESNNYKSYVDSIMADLDNLVIYKQCYLLTETSGYTTIWFPQSYTTYQNMIEDYNNLSFNKLHWTRIIDAYFDGKCE